MLALAQEISHPTTLSWALEYAARLYHDRRDAQQTQKYAEALITLASEHGYTTREAVGTSLRGWALTIQGQKEEGIGQLSHVLTSGQRLGTTMFLDMLTAMAEAYGKVGRAAEGMTVLTEALALSAKIGQHSYESELYRLKGELLGQQAADKEPRAKMAAEAETCFRQALDIARRQHAKSLELRAAMSLSRLWQQQGKHQAAHDLLAPAYGWFTEGFDTVDLQEARALLEALA